MSQKLTRTINLPRPPASFDPEVRRFFDDYSRAITAQFQDAFDLFGDGDVSLEAHTGNITYAHGATESPSPAMIARRTGEGKLRFVGADGSESSEDYGVTWGSVAQMNAHMTQTKTVHGCTTTPLAGHIPAFTPEATLRTSAPIDNSDCVPKSYVAASDTPSAGKYAKFNTNGRLQTEYPVSGKDAASYEFVVNAIDNNLTRLICRAKIYDAAAADTAITLREQEDASGIVTTPNITLPSGLYLVTIRLYEAGYTKLAPAGGDEVFGGYGTAKSGIFRLSSSQTLCLYHSVAITAKSSAAGYGIEIISL